jgi:hypothetical protein
MPKPHYAVQSFETGPRPPIALSAVESNLIHSVGYDKESTTLAVTFKRKDGPPSAVYHYPDVSPVLHAEFIGAESLGKFHGEHIKPLPFKKYHPDPETATCLDDVAAESLGN